MNLVDAVRCCPEAARLWPSYSSLAAFSHRTFTHVGSGNHRHYSARGFRILVAFRLIGLALTEMTGGHYVRYSITKDTLRAFLVQVEEYMPTEIVCVTLTASLVVKVPSVIADELNALDLVVVGP